MSRRRGPMASGAGMGGMNPNDLMRQVQKMQQEMAQVQQETEQEQFVVSSGGGMVEVTITGGLNVRTIKIKPEVVDPEDVEMLEDMITSAVNEAIQKAQGVMSERLGRFTGGLGIPGL